MKGAPRKVAEAHMLRQTIIMYAVEVDAPVTLGAVARSVHELGYPTVIPIANLGAAALQEMIVTLDLKAGRVCFA